MQKLMKNKIFTLVVAVCLLTLAALLLLDGLGVGDLYIGRRILYPLAGALLLLYVALTLFPALSRTRGALRLVLIVETVLLLLAAVSYLLADLIALPLLSDLTVCALIGLTLALRGAALCVTAYLHEGEKRAPLWHFILYLCLLAVGVWQMSAPLVPDRLILLVIGILAFVAAVYFAIGTVINFKKASRSKSTKASIELVSRDN